MNICIVSQRYPYKDNMEFVFVKKLVDEWVKMGHHCYVITPFPIQVYLRKNIQYKPAYYRDEVAPGVFVDVYNPRNISIPGFKLFNRLTGRFNPVRAFERQIEKLGVKFDFIYCHFFGPSMFAFPYAFKNNIPFFVATGESVIDPLHIPANSFTWEDYRRHTNGVIAVSSKNKEEAVKIGYAEEINCSVFPNGTDLSVFRKLDKQGCRRMLGLPLDAFIIICVGFFCNRKGQNRVLFAINSLGNPSIKAVFLGKSAANEPIVLEGDNIVFKGSVVNTQLPEYLSAADVFCLPTQHEGCCNAVIEAMACGCSIISSDRSFNHDVLNTSNSILVDPDNIEEIANAIKTMYEDKNLREKLANQAYEDARSLGIQQRAQNILTFIETKIQNK